MRDRAKLIILILFLGLAGVVTALPFVGLYHYAVSLPHTYKDSYYAALPVKYDRLCTTQNKIVVIGGSSVAFGIDSKLVEQELGRPCVNFGLYAAFGLKPMLDLSLGAIESGDVVIIAPELSSQMYSDYIGYDYLLQACEGRSDMVQALGYSYTRGLLSEFPEYLENAKKVNDMGGLNVKGVYALASFDTYGDIVYERKSNTMDGYYSADNLPEINATMVSDDFANLLNEYAKCIKEKGATVYFGFCPINELSAASVSQEEKENFVLKLEEVLDFEIISSLEDHIMDAGYFFDSNFHTNDAGMVYNTVLLINDLKRSFGTMTATNIEIPAPYTPEIEESVALAGVSDGFLYEVTSAGVAIVGLDTEGMTREELEIPSQIENYTVIKISNNAFEGCSAKRIVFPETITVLSANIFKDAHALECVELRSRTLPEVGSSMLAGANNNVKIYVPEELYSNYVTDYFWAIYADSIDKLKK